MRFPKILLPIFFLLLVWLFYSCEVEDSGPVMPPQEPTQIEYIVLPDNIVLNSDYFHTFQVALSGAAFEGDVLCEIKDSDDNSLSLFSLYDDANAYLIENTPAYVSETSGDVVAGDGIYTRKLNSLFTDSEGAYTAIFKVLSSDTSVNLTTESIFNIYENQPPIIYPLDSTITTLESGFNPFDLNIRVEDPQGWEDIVEVKFELIKSGFPLNLEYVLSDPDMDSVFTYNMQPSFAIGLETGDYEFRFSAEDSLNEMSYLPDIPVFIENGVPILSDGAIDSGEVILLPDPGDTTEVKVTVAVFDPQTLGDIDSVYINYERPEYVPFEIRWTFGYPMADNGLDWDFELYLEGLPYLGDETPGDGIFTFTKLYTSTADTGLHKFHFHCVDLADNIADSITVELRIQ